MIKLTVFILIFSVWQVLLDQCCKRKILDGKEYQLRETNHDASSKHGCLDNCVYEDSENTTFCFKAGSFPVQCIAPVPTSSEVEEGFTNLTVRDGNQGFLCNLNFNFILNKTFQLESESSTSCFPWNNLTDSLRFLEENKFQIKTIKGLDLDCTMIPIFSASESGSIRFADKSVHKTLKCEVSAQSCLTNNGSVYPAKCEPTFRYKGREYHACTDQGLSEDDDRLWCATKVDNNYNLVDGQWGFCSSKCSYCGGSPVNETSSRAFQRPCGYDCLVNTGKIMGGSSGIENVPLLRPTATLHGQTKENFIKEVQGQIQLFIGEQIVRITCPLSKFMDPDLKGLQTVLAVCGPKQYRFTIYSLTGSLIHEEFKNDRFGCDPCPNTYHYVPGYMSSTQCSHRGTSFQIPNVDLCEDRCYETKSCKSFSYSMKDQICKLFSEIIVEPTYASNYEDYVTCTKDAECCETIMLSSTGGTAQFQSSRLGKFVKSGRYKNRIVYEQEEGSKILFYSGYKEYGWVVASGFGSLGGLRSLSSSGSICPNDGFGWAYYTGNSWIPDNSLEISCEGQLDVKSEDFKRGVFEEAQLLIESEAYQSLTKANQQVAYELLGQSIVRGTTTYLDFGKSNLPSYQAKAGDADILFRDPGITNEYVYFFPKEDRLKNVVHEIGHLMLEFGRKTVQTRKLILIGRIVYEILLSHDDSLYDNPVTCMYTDKTTKEQCLKIVQKYKQIIVELSKGELKPVNGIQYGELPNHIKPTNIKMIYQALNKLFASEVNPPISPNYYDSDDDDIVFQAFLAEKLAVAIFLETVRNIEMLPVTLALLTLWNRQESGQIGKLDLLDTFPTKIHPMTSGGTFYNHYRQYELGRADAEHRMNGVGFFPVTNYVEFKLSYIDGKFDTHGRDYVKNVGKVHAKALTIITEYATRINEPLVNLFFKELTDKQQEDGVSIAKDTFSPQIKKYRGKCNTG